MLKRFTPAVVCQGATDGPFKPKRRTPNGKREVGAAIVEFALVLPLLILLVFGAIDFGFVSNDSTKLRQAVRESGRRSSVWRYGRTLCRDGGPGLIGNRPMPGTNLVGLSAAELLTPSSTNEKRIQEARKLQCQLKYFALDAGLSVRTAVRVVTYDASGTLQPERNALPVFGPASVNSFAVVVCAQYKTSSRTGLFGSMLNQKILHSRVTMRIATPLANTATVFPGAVEETPLDDGVNPGNWNNCVPSE